MSAPRPPARRRRPEDLVLVGKVGRPYGLTGAFHVIGRDGPVPTAYRELWLGSVADAAEPVRLEWSRGQGAEATLKISAAGDRNAAQAIVGQLLFVERERLAAAGTGLVWADLEGADVVDAGGKRLGRVARVYNVGASDVAEIVEAEAPGGAPGRRPRTLDLPLVSDYLDLDQRVARTQAEGETRVVTLLVNGSVFDDLWSGGEQPASKPGGPRGPMRPKGQS